MSSKARQESPTAAILAGCAVGFVVAVDLIRALRFELLTDAELSWAVPRLFLTALVASAAAGAGGATASAFLQWSRTADSRRPLEALPFRPGTLVFLAMAALAFGAFARFVWLDQLPPTIWIDEVLPVRPALALAGKASDFADAIRILPSDGPSNVFIGVLYLEGFRWLLHAWGTNLTAIRLPGAIAGTLSLFTAMWLGRTLLPRGGGALAGLALAGFRWQVLLARFAWNGLALAPIVDVATILLIYARRKASPGLAILGGLLAGIGAHVYLGAWIAGVALAGFLVWPSAPPSPLKRGAVLTLAFGLGFLVAVSPIFLLRKGREVSYFVRASSQSLLIDFRRTKSYFIPLSILADSFQAPWFLHDPVARQDIPAPRLGWILGLPFGVTLLRSLRLPREELSALIFPHCAAAIAATLRWGLPGHPNGFRFLYLSTLTAVAIAAGALWLVRLARAKNRRMAAIGVVGLFSIASFIGTRQALVEWAESRATFDAYSGESTLIGRAALRWERLGRVTLDPGLQSSLTVVGTAREFRLDPADARFAAAFEGMSETGSRDLCFAVVPPNVAASAAERRVESVQDAWGRTEAAVIGSRCATRRPGP
jgi:hypothetical protein